MPRKPLTHADRVAKVRAAVESLNAAYAAAQSTTPGTADSLKAWEAVEDIGATIHRQSRLLAGKSRGG